MNQENNEAELPFEMSMFPGVEITPELLLEQNPTTRQILENADRFRMAAQFGAMLLDMQLQSNCVRLEALVHLAVAYASGSSVPTSSDFIECFNELGAGICGRMEDPAEDVFVSLVTTTKGNFRVPSGIWENGAFYLQRILAIVESFPDEGHFSLIRRQVFSLLRLSDAVCERVGLTRYAVGQQSPFLKIKKRFVSDIRPEAVLFTCLELMELGIDKNDLDMFTLDRRLFSVVGSEPIQNSPLQRHPILDVGERLALVLPTAVTYAIRALVIDFISFHQLGESLLRYLAVDYAELFSRVQLLGTFARTPIHFSNECDFPMAEVMTEVDYGCYLHLLLFIDTLTNFNETGVSGLDPTPAEHVDLFATRIREAIAHARKHPHFSSGVTLLVHCGIGRGVAVPLPEIGQVHWSVQFLSAPDLNTLSWLHNFKAVTLLKILDAERRLPLQGVEIHNHNGLLNLIAWVEANEGHIVAHSQLPKQLRRSNGGIFIDPSFVLGLRAKIAIENDCHAVQTVDGEMKVVRHFNDSLLPGGNGEPIYTVETFSSENGIPFTYLSSDRAWWCHVIPSKDGNPGDYDRWVMLKTWLPRIVREIEPRLGGCLAEQVLLRIRFERCDSTDVTTVPTKSEIEQSFSTSIDMSKQTVTILVGQDFDRGLGDSTNVAERQLVLAICRGFFQLANVEWSMADLDECESKIVESDAARHMHRFQARTFRQFVAADVGRVIRPDDYDVAALRMGMAFRVESRLEGRSQIRSKKQCTLFLNALVKNLEDGLCFSLRQFDRATLVEMSLRNHEAAVLERERWSRTARANLALHADKASISHALAEHDAELSGVLFPSRVLTEIAVCECPVNGGRPVSRREFVEMLTMLNAIYIYGGWSDSIHREAMPPRLYITPLGDVQINVDFESRVLKPFAIKGSSNRIDSFVKEYESNFEAPEVIGPNELDVEEEFKLAWAKEYGFELIDILRLCDAIEDVGIELKKVAFRIKKSELRTICEKVDPSVAFTEIMNCFSLGPRASWRTIPDDLTVEHIQPWKFRRALSAVRRPIIQLDDSGDPEMLIAPGFIRESLAHVVRCDHEGTGHRASYKTNEMSQWSNRQNKHRGANFVQRVWSTIKECDGWKVAKIEMEVKEILGTKSDPEFGDLKQFGDVDVLAWNEAARRILVVECKYLYFKKTPGEIAEQLSDYRGQMKSNGKPDDLKKHLNRLEILRARQSTLCKKLGVDSEFVVEGWIVFKNPVPMLYAWHEFAEKIKVATFDDLEAVLSMS